MLLPLSITILCAVGFAHHAGQCEQCGLDLSHVSIFKQVIGLEDVIGLQAIGQDGFDEIPKVFQLQSHRDKANGSDWL